MSSNDTMNIFICGVGGQGVILASELMCEVARRAGKDVKKSEVHGMAQRGGSVVSHVRWGETVHSPLIELGAADYIMSFELVEALRWLHYLKPGGTVITSTQRIVPITAIKGEIKYPGNVVETLEARAGKVFALPALEMAKEAGNARAVNTLLLGVLARQSEDIPREDWVKVIEEKVKPKTIEVNKKAFAMGYEYENAPAGA